MRSIGLPAALLCLVASFAYAQVGDDVQFQVNSYTPGAQERPDVAASGEQFLVVWEAASQPGDDSGDAVVARRVDSTGALVGSELLVNTYTIGQQRSPAVAPAASGGFVVVYESTCPSATCIYGRRIDSAGMAAGAEFRVDVGPNAGARYPAVGSLDTGAFVVAWHASSSSGNDDLSNSIQARRFSSAGMPEGAVFQVNSYTTGYQGRAAVSPIAGTGFLVAWESFGDPVDAFDGSIQASIVGAAPEAMGNGQFRVNSYTTTDQTAPRIAPGPDGDVYMVWESYGSAGTDTEAGRSIQFRAVDSTGSPIGVDFQVNTYTTDFQSRPDVGVDSAGEFVVAWESYGSLGDDDLGYSVQMRELGAMDDPAEMQVNTYTPSSQRQVRVARDSAGNTLVVWESDGDGSGDGVFARAFTNLLFEDGFEEESTDAWDDVADPEV